MDFLGAALKKVVGDDSEIFRFSDVVSPRFNFSGFRISLLLKIKMISLSKVSIGSSQTRKRQS